MKRVGVDQYFAPEDIRPGRERPRYEGTVRYEYDDLHIYQHDPVNRKRDTYANYKTTYVDRLKNDSRVPEDSPIRKSFDNGLFFQKYKWEDGVRKVNHDEIIRELYKRYGEGVYNVFWIGGAGNKHPRRVGLISRKWISENKLPEVRT